MGIEDCVLVVCLSMERLVLMTRRVGCRSSCLTLWTVLRLDHAMLTLACLIASTVGLSVVIVVVIIRLPLIYVGIILPLVLSIAFILVPVVCIIIVVAGIACVVVDKTSCVGIHDCP